MALNITLSLIMAIVICLVNRRTSVILLLSSAVLIPQSDVLMVGPLDFFSIRIVVLGAIVRLIIRREFLDIRLNQIDRLVISFVVASVLIFFLRRGDIEAFLYRMGFAYNTLGVYFFLRANLFYYEDTLKILRVLAIVVAVLALGMAIEFATLVNPFKFLGARVVPVLREGIPRCTGTFRHSILSGTFGATMLPLMGILLFRKKFRIFGILGVFSSFLVVVLSHSSGPLLTFIFVMCGIFLWRYRMYMKNVRWLIILFIFSLSLVMKAPVWFIIARLSGIFGGTGWHRSKLIDSFIRYFDEWWFLGTDKTSHWVGHGIHGGSQMADITNQFIRIGVDGGFLSLLIFIWLLTLCFKMIGTRMKEIEPSSREGAIFYWVLGVVLVGHIGAFFSVSYFDNIFVFLYFVITLIAKSTFDKKYFFHDRADAK